MAPIFPEIIFLKIISPERVGEHIKSQNLAPLGMNLCGKSIKEIWTDSKPDIDCRSSVPVRGVPPTCNMVLIYMLLK